MNLLNQFLSLISIRVLHKFKKILTVYLYILYYIFYIKTRKIILFFLNINIRFSWQI